MAFKLTKNVEREVNTTLAALVARNLDLLEVPDTQGMVLVKAGSIEEAKRKQPGNQLAEYKIGENTYILCNA